MRDARREHAQRRELLHQQILGLELARAVEHLMDAQCGELVALPRHLPHVRIRDDQHFQRLGDDDLAGRARHSGIRQKAAQVAALPFLGDAGYAASFEPDRKASRQHDPEVGDYRLLLPGYYVASVELLQGPMRHKPFELRARDRLQCWQSGQPLDQRQVGHTPAGAAAEPRERPGRMPIGAITGLTNSAKSEKCMHTDTVCVPASKTISGSPTKHSSAKTGWP